jgi:hypothetical protein
VSHTHIPTLHSQNSSTSSYANEKSHLISVNFDEDKGAKKTIIAVVFLFVMLLGYSALAFLRGLEKSFFVLRSPAALEQQDHFDVGEGTRPPVAGPTGNPDLEGDRMGNAGDGLTVDTGPSIFEPAPPASTSYWDELQGDTHCIAYGTRRYTARLRNAPFWANRTQACMETAIQINGFTLRSPDECEVKVS